jgi:phosphate transport system substrate-binding protein
MKSIHIGRYRLIARLGRGKLTEVFLGLLPGTADPAQLVVVKRLRADVMSAHDGQSDAPLTLGAAFATRLQHPNIVRTHEVAMQGKLPFRAVEYLAGEPLDLVLSAAGASGGLAVPLALQVVCDVLAALAYAHDLAGDDGVPLGIVHRDIRPHNIFLTYQGEVKLVDLGQPELATDDSEAAPSAVDLTYAAPEQALGMPVDRRADLFAVGVVLWECLAQRRLLAAETPAATREKLLYEPLPPLASVRPELDPALSAICDRALARDPEQRYPSAGAMLSDLQQVLGASPDRAELASFMQALFESDRHERAASIEQLVAEARGVVIEAPAQPTFSESSALLVLPLSESPPSSAPAAPWKKRVSRLAGLSLALFGTALAVAWTRWPTKHSEPGAASALPAPPPKEQSIAAGTEIVLRLCGSNTIGAELAPALVEALLSSKGGTAVTRRHDADAELTTLLTTLGGKALGVEISARGSATAFSGLAAGTCDVGMASRPIEDAEASALLARGYGDLRSAAAEHVIALDGVAVIVHPNNPLRALDRAALHDIYVGKVADWSALGGAAGPISVLARDSKSGTFDTFKHLVLGQDELAAGAKRYAENAALADAVASEPSAIGFVGLAYVRAAKALAVGEPGAAPVLPTQFTVATEGYMLSRRLYLYTLPKPRTTWVTELVSFALSRRAQELAANNQFVDLRLMTQPSEPAPHASARYAATVAKALRVSVDFRFRSGSDQLDSRAARDLDRFVAFLDEHRAAKVLLLGFSDAVGSATANRKLSQDRAMAIEHELALRGVHAAVVSGFGSEMPVASNETDSGRQRNRRVEVWIRPLL